MSKRTIQRLEKGESVPTAATALSIAHSLGYVDPLVVFPELLESA